MQVVLNLSHLLFGVIRISGLSKTIVYTKTLISRVILNQIRRKMYECIRIRASNNGRSMDNVRSKIGFVRSKSLDGRRICPIVYAGKEKI